jgi:serine/threonine protein kinase
MRPLVLRSMTGGRGLEVARTCTQCDSPAETGKDLCSSCEVRSLAEAQSEASAILEKIPGERYEILSRLGTGAFGSVYQALDTFLNRLVAVKSIRLDTTLDPEHRKALNKRFIREAQVAAQLHHPNIVTIHDIIFTPDTGFIVMEFIEGRTLQSLLKEQRLPLATAVDLVAQVASALSYAHEHKIIHRDVKPANIMITPRFEARITDFGIAKSDGATHLTMSGSLVGTPDYMSPEQAKGEDVDVRSDIFSLGCVLYECIVGEKPFKGGSLTGVLLNIVNSDPLRSSDWTSRELPREVADVAKRALAKDPEKRFQTAAELLASLRALDGAAASDARAGDAASQAAPSPRTDDARTVIAGPEETKPEPVDREEQLRQLKEEDRPLKFAPTLSDQLQDISLTPAQGFILSRIDGASLARDILALSPIPEAEVAATLAELLDKGLLAWSDLPKKRASKKEEVKPGRRGGKSRSKSTSTSTSSSRARATETVVASSASRPAAPFLDDRLEAEMERLLELGGEERYSELLGVEDRSAGPEVKKSYLELIERFHPDAHPENLDPDARRKLSKVCAAATEALTALSAKTAAEGNNQPSHSNSNSNSHSHANSSSSFSSAPPARPPAPPRAGTSARTMPSAFDRARYAEDLFRLAQRAYDTFDYWKAIQLVRQAIELDDTRAEYHHLLGIGLMKNRNWLKEAEECLRKATELDPNNAQYFGLLATVYKAEGLPERSQSMLEKAKSLDPGYC